ncbi:MAG: hypothetical protein JW947_03310 [Sedimentisphaerales bacterium]|nr:hypothetical protein [Sedimentisphaerales bacterium]
MTNSYSSLCDDFYLDMYINTKLPLPRHRDTVLAFFERIQKQYPSMGSFFKGENSECCLEENMEHPMGSDSEQYRWVALEIDRIGSGVVNPSNFENAYSQDRLVIELAPYMLSLNHLDIDSLDVTFAMDFNYAGSHDEVIAEALFGSTAFSCLLDLPEARPVSFSPSIVTALSEDGLTQGRISVESKTSDYEPKGKRRAADDAISLFFTIRRYSSGSEKFDALKSFEEQCRLAEELMAEKIVPNFALPLINVIAQKRLT